MEKRGNFTSKLGMILASAGSAVGLGNVWRFPTEVGNNGGAAFILIYLCCVAFVGIPVMISEFLIGRHAKTNAVTAFRQLAPGTPWRWQGVASVFTAFIILSYYVVVAGWTLFYLIHALSGSLAQSKDYAHVFNSFVTNPWQPVLYAVLFMGMTHWVVVRGVQSGIERCSKVMMPILLLIIGILVICSFSMPGASEGWHFLLRPDFSKLNTQVFLSAVGQAFYSLSLAMGCLCTYASYFNKDARLVKTAISVSAIDTSVALLCVLIIFPAVFSMPELTADAGPGLVFITLPNVFQMAFGGMPAIGYIFSALFYLLLLLAALTSSISLHESVSAYVIEALHISRRWASVWVSVVAMLLGVGCALSFGPWSSFTVFGLNLFDLFDYVTSKIIMPLGGIAICLFTGWYLNRKLVHNELTNDGRITFRLFRLYIFLIRYFVPVVITLIFLNGIL